MLQIHLQTVEKFPMMTLMFEQTRTRMVYFVDFCSHLLSSGKSVIFDSLLYNLLSWCHAPVVVECLYTGCPVDSIFCLPIVVRYRYLYPLKL